MVVGGGAIFASVFSRYSGHIYDRWIYAIVDCSGGRYQDRGQTLGRWRGGWLNEVSEENYGGGGGFVTAQYNVVPGAVVKVGVGKGGANGGGGGASMVWDGSGAYIWFAVAGGGGAGADAPGGAAGGTYAQAGSSADDTNGGNGASQYGSGAGGSGANGGPDGNSGGGPATLGIPGAGGASNYGGGAGGAGYYGGGAGGWDNANYVNGGGGGGSSWYDSYAPHNYIASSGNTIGGNNQQVANSADSDYPSSGGYGNGANRVTEDGLHRFGTP